MLSAVVRVDVVVTQEAGLHAGDGVQAAVVCVAAADLQADWQAFQSLREIPSGLSLDFWPSITNAAKATSAVVDCVLAAAPLAVQQLMMQQPGGQGAQSAGLQLAWL